MDPRPQHEVIERHVALVVPQRVQKLAKWHGGEEVAGSFINQQAGRAQGMQAQYRADHHYAAQDQRSARRRKMEGLRGRALMRVIFEPGCGQRVPVRLWARRVAPETIRQLQRLASQPYVVEFVAGMADAHVSEGVAVESVFATEATVVPRALGGDLGCGMSARRIASARPVRARRRCDAPR